MQQIEEISRLVSDFHIVSPHVSNRVHVCSTRNASGARHSRLLCNLANFRMRRRRRPILSVGPRARCLLFKVGLEFATTSQEDASSCAALDTNCRMHAPVIPPEPTSLFGLLQIVTRSTFFWLFSCHRDCPSVAATAARMSSQPPPPSHPPSSMRNSPTFGKLSWRSSG